MVMVMVANKAQVILPYYSTATMERIEHQGQVHGTGAHSWSLLTLIERAAACAHCRRRRRTRRPHSTRCVVDAIRCMRR